MYNDFGKFFEIARRTNRLSFLLFLNTRVSTFCSILFGSRQRSSCRRARVRHFRFNFFPALNLSRRDRQQTNNIESTRPMIYTVSLQHVHISEDSYFSSSGLLTLLNSNFSQRGLIFKSVMAVCIK